MDIKKVALPIVLASLLAGCSSLYKEPPVTGNLDKTDASLAEAAYSVNQSIVSLAETAQAAHPMPTYASPASPASYGMAAITSVDWSGPVAQLLDQIAKSANYRLRILGTEPAIPVLVTIYAKNTMLADILRDVAYQCGRRATVVVFPDSRTIELRYANN